MKETKIYVCANGAPVKFQSGRTALAWYPPEKGEKESFILLDDGKMSRVEGARMEGLGIPRWLQGKGYVLAEPSNPLAVKLADRLDVREGTKLVEKASVEQACALQKRFGGQECTYVPFDPAKPAITVKVEEPGPMYTTSSDLTTGFTSGTVRTEWECGVSPMQVALADGWLVGPGGDPAAMPRNTEYGGLMELAAFVICNSGIGHLVGAHNLEMKENAAEDDPFPRGELRIALENGDMLLVGDDGADQLAASYVRDGQVLYSRTGMTHPRLGEVIGDIAAVIVRVGEMDAANAKKKMKKAA